MLEPHVDGVLGVGDCAKPYMPTRHRNLAEVLGYRVWDLAIDTNVHDLVTRQPQHSTKTNGYTYATCC